MYRFLDAVRSYIATLKSTFLIVLHALNYSDGAFEKKLFETKYNEKQR